MRYHCDEIIHTILQLTISFVIMDTDPSLQFSSGSCICPSLCVGKDKFQGSSLHDASDESHLQVVDTRQCSSPVSGLVAMLRLRINLCLEIYHLPLTRELSCTLKRTIYPLSRKLRLSIIIPPIQSHLSVSHHIQLAMFWEPQCS